MPTPRSPSFFAIPALAFVMALTGACKKSSPGPDDPTADDHALLAQDGSDTNAVESDSELLTTSLVTASSGTAPSLSTTPEAFFLPKGCLAVTTDDASRTKTYAFASCLAGPAGLAHVKGEVKIHWDVSPGQLVLTLTGTGLELNKATADYAATATITTSGVDRTMTWKAQLSGTTWRGRPFTRTNDKVVSWKLGEKCFSLQGTSEGDVKGRDLRTVITDFSRCEGQCPARGGKIAITNTKTGTTVNIEFDGTANAVFDDGKQPPVSFPLSCGG